MATIERRIAIYDTTLRDGEQAPGASMTPDEKLFLARQLERLGVDVIEAGFPISSDGDFLAVQMIAREVRGVQIAALARAERRDIDCAWEALREADRPRLNIILGASDIHLRHQLKKSRAEVIDLAVAALAHARHYTDNLEFSALDAGRSEPSFLRDLFAAVIAAGAKVVNIPDTVGYAVPDQWGNLVRYLLAETEGIGRATLSVHCHDDLGLATANTLAAVQQGAGQVKCTMNGIGERAGNASLEEVVMALATRRDVYGVRTGIRTEQLYPTSQLLVQVIDMPVPPNKAIVGANAFAHESGIHQDGLLKAPSTYEIISPKTVGAPECTLVFGRHSGTHAVARALAGMGYEPTVEEVARVMQLFKQRASFRKELGVGDLEEIFCREVRRLEPLYRLVRLKILPASGKGEGARVQATVEVNGRPCEAVGCASTPLAAALAAVGRTAGEGDGLPVYQGWTVMEEGALRAEALVRLPCGKREVIGRGFQSDPLPAAAEAYAKALNLRAWARGEEGRRRGEKEEARCAS